MPAKKEYVTEIHFGKKFLLLADHSDKKIRADIATVEKILAKGIENLSPLDRYILLTVYNVSFHKAGKIAGVSSLDSTATNCEFCQAMRQAANGNPAHICGPCYDFAQEQYRDTVLNRHTLNMVIFSTIDFTCEELKALPLTPIVRGNSSGDVPNTIYARNFIRLAFAFPYMHFALWAKNTAPVVQACKDLTKPDNLVLIQSSPIIGTPAKKAEYFDYIFTVYATKADTEKAIASGAAECNGKSCTECGYKCYFKAHKSGSNIAEYLRGVNAAQRQIISDYLKKSKEEKK